MKYSIEFLNEYDILIKTRKAKYYATFEKYSDTIHYTLTFYDYFCEQHRAKVSNLDDLIHVIRIFEMKRW